MSARAASSALILSLLLVLAPSRPTPAGPWLPAPGDYYSELRGGLFSADTYHNADGDRASLAGKWEERSLLSTTEFGWKKRLSFVLGFQGLSATLRDTLTNRTPGRSWTSTGLKDIRVGLRWGITQGPSALALELDWQAPLGYSRDSVPADPVNHIPARPISLFNDPRLGGEVEGLSFSALYGTALAKRGFLQLGAGLGYRFLSLVPAAKAKGDSTGHYTINNEHGDPVVKDTIITFTLPDVQQPEGVTRWSYDLNTSADAGFWVSKSLLLGGRWIGMFNVSHGFLMPAQNVQLLGPVVVWRVDERLDLMAGSWSTAAGKNTLHYDQVYVALTFKQTRLNRLQGFLGGTKAP